VNRLVPGRVVVAVVAAAVVVVATLATFVTLPWSAFTRQDLDTEHDVHGVVLAHPAIGDIARLASHAGDPVVVTAAAVVIAVLLFLSGRAAAAVYVAVVRLLAFLAGGILKPAIGRPRPVFEHAIAHAGGYSFPSGHALGASALWVSLAVVFVGLLGRWFVAAAALVPLAVAATRVLLGVHYLSDVVAGLVLGTALALAPAWWLRRTATFVP
jgi:undecaprenyl-diphosphatase